MIEMLKQNADKFWNRVARHGDSECWQWMTHLNKDGYGHFQFRHNGQKKKFRAHRVAYMLTHNLVLTSDQFICHNCDNRSCVNPTHLIIGDYYTNIMDCVHRNRQAKGSKNGRSKLIESQVRCIKYKLANRQSKASIAREFGVSHRTITLISQDRLWKHVI